VTTAADQPVHAPEPRHAGRAAVAALAAPELIAAVLLTVGFTVASTVVRGFLDPEYLLGRATIDMEAGLLAITMTFVIGAGHIDLSVASILVLTSAVVARLHGAAPDVPVPVLAALAPVIGGALGLFNGVLVTRLGLPSLIVTLATMAGFRGLAQVLIGDTAVDAPAPLAGFDKALLAGIVPAPVVVFLGAAAVLSCSTRRSSAATSWPWAPAPTRRSIPASPSPARRAGSSCSAVWRRAWRG
jgi:rhamnose transport system permease protein